MVTPKSGTSTLSSASALSTFPNPHQPSIPSGLIRLHHVIFSTPKTVIFFFSHQSLASTNLTTWGSSHSYEPGNSWARALAISPEGNKIAYSTPSPHIFNWPEGGDQAIPNFDHTNGGRQGFDWMPDNKRFLFNDHLSVSLINTEDLSLQYRHYGLNEKLPPKRASNDDHRGWSGFHLDSRLVMNGSRFVTVYQSDSFWDVDNPEHQKLRFYDTETGVTLAEHILPKNPRSLRVTDDGLVVVLMVGDFHNFIHLFDAESMEKIGALDFKLINKFPPRIEVSPDHQHLLVESNRSWLVDLTDVAAPVKLKEYPSNTLLGRFTSESKTLVTMQMNLDVDVWKKRRDLSPLGAMVHWEYWGIQAVGIVCMFGIFIQVGRSTQRLRGEALPLLLWGAVLLLALGIGQQLAGLFLDPILTRVWGTDYGVSVGKTVWKSLGILLWFRVLIGLVRLETAWRKVALVLTMIGGILMIAITGWLGWLLSQIPGDLIQAEINKLVLTNGWRPKFSSMTSLIWSGVSANGVAAIWWILFRAPTRRIFVASVKTNPLAPSDDSR